MQCQALSMFVIVWVLEELSELNIPSPPMSAVFSPCADQKRK